MRHGQREAADGSPGVGEDGGRAALAMAADLLGAVDNETFPQRGEQRRERIPRDPMLPPVSSKRDLHVHAPAFPCELPSFATRPDVRTRDTGKASAGTERDSRARKLDHAYTSRVESDAPARPGDSVAGMPAQSIRARRLYPTPPLPTPTPPT